MKSASKQKWIVKLEVGQEDYSNRIIAQDFHPKGVKTEGKNILLAVMPNGDQPLALEHKIQVEVYASLSLDDVNQECLRQMKIDYTRLGGEFLMLYFKDPAKLGTAVFDRCYGVRDRLGKIRVYRSPLVIDPLPDIGGDPIKPAGSV